MRWMPENSTAARQTQRSACSRHTSGIPPKGSPRTLPAGWRSASHAARARARGEQRRNGDRGDRRERPLPAHRHRERRRQQRHDDAAQRHAGLLDREHQVAALGRRVMDQQVRRRRAREPHARADGDRAQRDVRDVRQREQREADHAEGHAQLRRERRAPAQHGDAAVDGSHRRRAESEAHVVADQHGVDAERLGHLGRDGGQHDVRHRHHHLRGGRHRHDEPGRGWNSGRALSGVFRGLPAW